MKFPWYKSIRSLLVDGKGAGVYEYYGGGFLEILVKY
jgi:hypothetical protein